MRLSPLPLRSDAQPYGVALQTVRELVRLEQSARTYETRLRIAQDPHIPRSALAHDAFGYVQWMDANVRLAERERGTRDAWPLASDMWRMNARTIVDPFLIASSMWRGWLAAQLTEGDEGDWILALYVGAELRMVWAVEPPPAGEERGWRMRQGDDEAHLPVEMERLVAARLALWPPPESIAIIEGRHIP